jgi:hypothetical protein
LIDHQVQNEGFIDPYSMFVYAIRSPYTKESSFRRLRRFFDAIDSKTLKLGTISDNKVYYIIFTTEAAKYDPFLPIVQNIINSLEFTALEREGIVKN